MINKKLNCTICNGEPSILLKFENFPRSSFFQPVSCIQKFEKGIDLNLVECQTCYHIYLANEYNADIYSEEEYSYRTNIDGAKQLRFIQADLNETYNEIQALLSFGSINTILEVGANDLSFLTNLRFRGRKIGIDPILNKKITGATIEQHSCFAEQIPDEILESADLFISRHNIEHILDPAFFLERIVLSSKGRKKYFFVEIPDTDKLIENSRFDQVFLEHMHYFNYQSLLMLMNKFDFDLIKSWKNDRYSGSICAIFEFTGKKTRYFSNIRESNSVKIINSYSKFKSKCNRLRSEIENDYGNFYGYGAGHSLPFLAYHIDGRFHHLEAIFDDSLDKVNKRINGIAPPIIHSDNIMEEYKILITASDYTNEIMAKMKNHKNIFGLLI